ncbi:MAG: hypothetical protein H7196_01620 [candidate division SR1 bacterium]|nr:hypothetical protein [candidate division SR1 bacterium]
MSIKHTQRKISKKLNEIYEELSFKINDLESLVEKTKFMLESGDSNKTRLNIECGKIATILYVILIDSNKNSSKPQISLLQQLNIKSRFYIFITSIPQYESMGMPDGSRVKVVIDNNVVDDQIITAVNHTYLTSFKDDKVMPKGSNLLLERIPINRFLSQKIDGKMNRQQYISFFRNTYGSHTSNEIDNNFDPKSFRIVTSSIAFNAITDYKQNYSAQATLLQIAIELLYTYAKYKKTLLLPSDSIN